MNKKSSRAATSPDDRPPTKAEKKPRSHVAETHVADAAIRSAARHIRAAQKSAGQESLATLRMIEAALMVLHHGLVDLHAGNWNFKAHRNLAERVAAALNVYVNGSSGDTEEEGEDEEDEESEEESEEESSEG